MLFEEPVLLTANSWYVALAKISGPSSDCGSNGQYVVTGEDQYVPENILNNSLCKCIKSFSYFY